jgi:hypothetical protein
MRHTHTHTQTHTPGDGRRGAKRALVMLVPVAMALLAAGGWMGVDVVDPAEAQGVSGTFDLNNMQCAQNDGGIPMARVSGFPFADDAQNARHSCNAVLEDTALLGSYAVTTSNLDPALKGEVYIRSSNNALRQASVCMTVDGDGFWIPFTCGPLREHRGHLWANWWKDKEVALPSGQGPQEAIFNVCVDITGNGQCNAWDDWNHVHWYNGGMVDPGHIVDLNADTHAVAADNFTWFKLHDPAGDDVIVIGGIPITLLPGSVI